MAAAMKAALVRELRTSYPEAELDHWQQAASWLMASGVRLVIELDSTQLWLEPGWNGLQPLSQMCIRAAVDRATKKGDERRMRPRSVEIRSPPPPVITTGGACQLSGVHRATLLNNTSGGGAQVWLRQGSEGFHCQVDRRAHNSVDSVRIMCACHV